MFGVFMTVLRRDLAISLRQRGTLVHHLLFFVLVVALFPLGTNTDRTVLIAVAPALIWMSVLLSRSAPRMPCGSRSSRFSFRPRLWLCVSNGSNRGSSG